MATTEELLAKIREGAPTRPSPLRGLREATGGIANTLIQMAQLQRQQEVSAARMDLSLEKQMESKQREVNKIISQQGGQLDKPEDFSEDKYNVLTVGKTKIFQKKDRPSPEFINTLNAKSQRLELRLPQLTPNSGKNLISLVQGNIQKKEEQLRREALREIPQATAIQRPSLQEIRLNADISRLDSQINNVNKIINKSTFQESLAEIRKGKGKKFEPFVTRTLRRKRELENQLKVKEKRRDLIRTGSLGGTQAGRKDSLGLFK